MQNTSPLRAVHSSMLESRNKKQGLLMKRGADKEEPIIQVSINSWTILPSIFPKSEKDFQTVVGQHVRTLTTSLLKDLKLALISSPQEDHTYRSVAYNVSVYLTDLVFNVLTKCRQQNIMPWREHKSEIISAIEENLYASILEFLNKHRTMPSNPLKVRIQDSRRQFRNLCETRNIRSTPNPRKQPLGSDNTDYYPDLYLSEERYEKMHQDLAYEHNYLWLNNLRLHYDEQREKYVPKITAVLNYFLERTSLYDRSISNDKWHFSKDRILIGKQQDTMVHLTHENVTTFVETLFPRFTPSIKHELRLAVSIDVRRALQSWADSLGKRIQDLQEGAVQTILEEYEEQVKGVTEKKLRKRELLPEEIAEIRNLLPISKISRRKLEKQDIHQCIIDSIEAKERAIDESVRKDVLTYCISDASNYILIQQVCELLQSLLYVEKEFNEKRKNQNPILVVDFYVPEIVQLEIYCPDKLLVETVLRGIEQYPCTIKLIDRQNVPEYNDVVLDLNPQYPRYLIRTGIHIADNISFKESAEKHEVLQRIKLQKALQFLMGDKDMLLEKIFTLRGNFQYKRLRETYESICLQPHEYESLRVTVDKQGELCVEGYTPSEVTSGKVCYYCKKILQTQFQYFLKHFRRVCQSNQTWICFLCAFLKLDQSKLQHKGLFKKYFELTTDLDMVGLATSCEEESKRLEVNTIYYVIVISKIVNCGIYRAFVYGTPPCSKEEGRQNTNRICDLYFMKPFSITTDPLLLESRTAEDLDKIGPLLSCEDIQAEALYILMPSKVTLKKCNYNYEEITNSVLLSPSDIRLNCEVTYFEEASTDCTRLVIDRTELRPEELVQKDQLAAFMKMQKLDTFEECKTRLRSILCFTRYLSNFDFINIFNNTLEQISLTSSLKQLRLNSKFDRLRVLDISDNELQKFDIKTAKFPALQYFEIKNTFLKSLDLDDDESPLPKITSIKILSNRYFENASFLELTLPTLTTINISHCKIKHVTKIWQMDSLKELDLSNNLLEEFIAGEDSRLPKLAKAKFDSNLMRVFDMKFCVANQLTSLSMSNNLLEELRLPPLPKIEVLELSFNYLTELNIDQLGIKYPRKKLLNVYFPYNQITGLVASNDTLKVLGNVEAFMNKGFELTKEQQPFSSKFQIRYEGILKFALQVTHLYLQWTVNRKDISAEKIRYLKEFPGLNQYVDWKEEGRIVIREKQPLNEEKEIRVALHRRLRQINQHQRKEAQQAERKVTVCS